MLKLKRPTRAPRARPPRTSELLRQIAEDIPGETIAMGAVFEALGARAFGPTMLLLGALVFVPVPPLVAAVSIVLVMLSAQMVVGSRRPWLPASLLARSVRKAAFKATVDRVLPWVQRFELVFKPRLGFLTGDASRHLVGLACLVLSLMIVAPVWGMNMLPAACIMLMAVGLIERDGVVIGVGLVASVLTVAFYSSVIAGVVLLAVRFIVGLTTGHVDEAMGAGGS